ncbi:MAG: hypothetical protein HN372_04005 [Acidiferrobacteraceae bacterium]|nr:hypothetical protein [Acidiferrobacteraceae bacterium]
MSRLDSAIRRLQAQRLCLNAAVAYVEELPGPFLELGLGNGRTYDHLREITPNRDIYVFERRPAAHPDCTPAVEFLIQGNFKETLGKASSRIGQPAALAHCDIGSGNLVVDKALAAQIGPAISALLAEDAIVLSDQLFNCSDWIAIQLPAGVAAGRYYMYRKSNIGKH